MSDGISEEDRKRLAEIHEIAAEVYAVFKDRKNIVVGPVIGTLLANYLMAYPPSERERQMHSFIQMVHALMGSGGFKTQWPEDMRPKLNS